MKLLFAVLPWHSLDYPCLAAGILQGLTARDCESFDFTQKYLNVDWCEWLVDRSDGNFSPRDYCILSEEFVFSLAGEWAFASALHECIEHRVEEYRTLFKGPDAKFERILFAHRQAYAFVEHVAQQIVDDGFDVVALSSTFTQNAACLALAKAIKKRAPHIITLMGGGNCDGAQGISIHRNFHFVDYVLRGEGEEGFPRLLNALARPEPEARDLHHVPGLCWWSGDHHRVNEQSTTEDMDGIPVPVYDDYFTQIEASPLREFLEPAIVMETARGCWWGEKHHCTFCGLNGSGMHFRSKSQERARDEVAALVTRYQVLDVILADNILDNEYFKNFLPAIVRDGWDLRLHYEIKANLKPAQIDLMRSAGVVHVQPGIESLSTRVLQLMDKGITGTRNVQALRDLHTANLSVSWNYLVGFPDETDDDYLEVIGQVRKLTHLQPPSGATRLALERFSPYFEKPWLGFERRWPHPAYPIIFSLDLAECDQFAFFFECDDLGISADCLRQVSQAIEDWRAAYEDGAALRYYTQENGDIEIIDGRPGFTGGQYTLTDRVQIAIFEVTSVPRKAAWLAARLDAEGFSRHDVAAALECLCDRLGLLFVEAGSYVNVTLPFAPYQRVDPQLLDAVFHPYH